MIFGGFVLNIDPPRITRAGADAYLIFEFPPQSFGEEAFLEAAHEFSPPPPDDQVEVSSHPDYPDKNTGDGGNETPPATLPAARVRMSGPSRVVVTMPADVASIGYDLVSLLTALRDWPMRLDGNARPDPLIRIEGLADAAHAAGLGTMLTAAAGVTFSTDGAALVPAHAHVAAAAIEQQHELLLVEPSELLPIVVGPHEPAPTVTALELPYRLITSPIESARWAHAPNPVEHHGRTELWHTRLTTSPSAEGPDAASRIRALWSPDYASTEAEMTDLIEQLSEPDLIRMSLDPVDRSMLVSLMSGYDAMVEGRRYKPLSSEAKRLHLSALGALLDTEGTWAVTPDDVDLEQWRHLATLGRDHYVRVMYKGYLCPFGHAASLVKVTERKFESLDANPSHRVAILRQRFFIVVREPRRPFNGSRHKFAGRNFPFTQVEILTRVTPDLAEPGKGESKLKAVQGAETLYDGIADRMLFWPMVPAPHSKLADVPFEIAATDIEGHRVTFAMPLLFVGKLADAKHADELKKSYNAAPAYPKRLAKLGGAAVTYAPSSPDDKTEPTLPTVSLTFAAGNFTGGSKVKPNFYPEIEFAEVGIKPIQKLLSQPNFISQVTYPSFYKTGGFSAANKGQVFLQLTSATKLAFGGSGASAKSDSLGALATPEMSLLGLSKVMGPVAGKDAAEADGVEAELASAKGGEFNPADFFKDATLLGGIKLGEIIPKRTDLSASNVPKMVSRDYPDRVEASFEWDTEVPLPDVARLLVPRADPSKPPTRLVMKGVVRTPHDPSKPASIESTATLTNFKVNLFGFIILWFEHAEFVWKNGQKPDVAIQLRDDEKAVMFGGALEFVNELRRFIPSNGFSDPPSLMVTPSGISASYSLTLPAVGVGVFALTNASLGAGFNLPFDGKPISVKFNFSTREQPFSLTVSLLGGGGFFAIGISSRGVNEIEAALEFGAAIAINLGVASGSVEVKAGVYFHWLEPSPGKGSVELAGYVRIHGELTVLAIISVSLTFHLQLGYLKENKKSIVYGEATLTVEIEILMFSAEVSVTCRREFAGAEADPRFIDLMPSDALWAEYCDAFAAEAA